MKRLLILLLIFSALSQAQFRKDVSGVGTNAASFLEIGQSARATAMGGAYTALANDATALYYNPAVMTQLGANQIEFSHINWFVDSSYDLLNVVFTMERSAFGISLSTLGYDKQPVRTEERPEGNGLSWDARDIAVSLGYAMAITDRFSFGAALKYINQRIYNTEASTVVIDLGIHYVTGFEGLKLGMSISNFGDELRLNGRNLHTTVDPDDDNLNVDRIPVSYNVGSYPLPLLFRGGISYHYAFNKMFSSIVSMDLNHPRSSTESINIGFEIGFKQMFFIRGGYENLFEEGREEEGVLGLKGIPSYGFGIDYAWSKTMGFRLDYAHSGHGLLGATDRFSMGISF